MFMAWRWRALLWGAAVCLACGMAQAQGLTLALARSTEGAGVYTPGTSLTVTLTLTASGTGTVTALGVEETIPADWVYQGLVAGSGVLPEVAPAAGKTGLLEFAWFSNSPPALPSFPVVFSYLVSPPFGQEGDKTISGRILYRYLETLGEFQSLTTETALSCISEPQTFYAGNSLGKQLPEAPLGSLDNPFPAIADAVTATVGGRGDTIYVLPGVYAESLSLKRNTALMGYRAAFHTHLRPGSGAPAITASDGCVVRRFSLTGGADGIALNVVENAGVEVTNVVLHSSGTGLWASAGSRVHLLNNVFSGNHLHGAHIDETASIARFKHNILVSNQIGLHSSTSSVELASHNGYYLNAMDHSELEHVATDVLAAPAFVDAEHLNFHLLPNSPMRDAGDPAVEENDLDGTRNDLGADGGPYGEIDTEPPMVRYVTKPEPPIVGVGGTIVFDGSTSYDAWGILEYRWDFDDRDGVLGDFTGAVAEWTYTAVGDFTATLRITDNTGFVVTSAVPVHVVGEGIEVLEPNGGERLPLGRNVEILWDERIGSQQEDIRIILLNQGIVVADLGTVAARDERFLWNISQSLPLGAGYSIKIRSEGSFTAEDVSDAPFSLVTDNNDTASASQWIGIDGEPVEDCFHYSTDASWFRFCAGDVDLGREILIATSNLTTGTDTTISLYSGEGQVLMAQNEDCPVAPPASCVTFVPDVAVCYYVHVTQAAPDVDYGVDTCYTLSVTHPDGLGPFPGVLTGDVRSALTHGPVPGARVSIDYAGLAALTDTEGVFAVRALPPGTYTAIASAYNFTSSTQTVSIPAGNAASVHFLLEGGSEPDAAEDVAASDGTYADRIHVSWVAAPYAVSYNVFRDDVLAAGGVAGVNFDDFSAGTGVHLYQVQARYPGGVGPLSNGDTGYRLLGPAAPEQVVASDGEFMDHIHVTWDASPGAAYYQVYRANGSDAFSDAEPVGDWTADTEYDDFEAGPIVNCMAFGCNFGAVKNERYYYWVVAGNASGESGPGGPDAGSRGDIAGAPFGCDAWIQGALHSGNRGDFLALFVLLAPLVVLGTRQRRRVLGRLAMALCVAALLAGCPPQRTAVGNGPGFEKPIEIAAAPDGKLLVLDSRLDAVLSVSPLNGSRSVLYTNADKAGPEWLSPSDIAAYGDSACLLLDTAYPAVMRVDFLTGECVQLTPSAEDGTPLSYPVAIDGDETHGFFIADQGVNAVFRLDPESGALTAISDAATGAGPLWDGCGDVVPLDEAALCVLATGAAALFRVDLATGDRTAMSGGGIGAGPPLMSPRRMAAGPGGTIAVFDSGPGALLLVDPATGARTVLSDDAMLGEMRGLTSFSGLSFYTLDPYQSAVMRIEEVKGNLSLISCADTSRRVAYLSSGALAPLGGGAWAVLDTERGDLLRDSLDGTFPETLFDASAEGLAWGAPVALASLPGDDFCVLDASTGKVVRVNTVSGAWTLLAGTEPQPPLSSAVDMAREGASLYVTDYTANAVFRVDPETGNRDMVSSDAIGSGPVLDGPLHIAGDTSGHLLVSCANGALYRIALATGVRTLVSGTDTGRGDAFGFITAICVAPGGAAYAVADAELRAVVLVDAASGDRLLLSGADAGTGPLFERPAAIATDGQRYLVADAELGAIFQVNPATGDRVVVSR